MTRWRRAGSALMRFSFFQKKSEEAVRLLAVPLQALEKANYTKQRELAISQRTQITARVLQQLSTLWRVSGDFLEARPPIPRLRLVVVGARSPGRRFLSAGANINESSLQFYVTMPIWVI
jgi:hypothetical protein